MKKPMTDENSYQETLDYLYSFIDYSLTRSFRYSPDKFDLDRMFKLMERVGNPYLRYPVIHIAGTKGKGSVSAFCAKVLQEAGYRVGLYTSPHLQQFTERIQVNGELIPHPDVINLVNEIKPHVSAIPHLTTFELMTALGFLYFARQNVDVAVVEVGLGGRLDATNIVNPMVSVITSLSFDHMNVLGNTLSEIASEKAGIIKSGRPVVLAPQKEEPLHVIEKIAAERNSPLIEIGKDYSFKSLSHSLDQQSFELRRTTNLNNYYDRPGVKNHFISVINKPNQFTIPLLGSHQVENATTAFAALEIVHQETLTLTEYNIKKGFETVIWPGRFEVLRKEPPVIVDSAHNSDSALRLRQAVDDYLPGRPVIMVFGASEDKDIKGMFAELIPRIKELVVTQSIHPRALNTEILATLAKEFNSKIEVKNSVEEALRYALEAAGKNAAVLVTGSIFVVAAARELWFNNNYS